MDIDKTDKQVHLTPEPPETPKKDLTRPSSSESHALRTTSSSSSSNSTMVQSVSRVEFQEAEGKVAALAVDVRLLKREMKDINATVCSLKEHQISQGLGIAEILARLPPRPSVSHQIQESNDNRGIHQRGIQDANHHPVQAPREEPASSSESEGPDPKERAPTDDQAYAPAHPDLPLGEWSEETLAEAIRALKGQGALEGMLHTTKGDLIAAVSHATDIYIVFNDPAIPMVEREGQTDKLSVARARVVRICGKGTLEWGIDADAEELFRSGRNWSMQQEWPKITHTVGFSSVFFSEAAALLNSATTASRDGASDDDLFLE